MDNLIDWFYGQVVGFLGNFFAEMGNMGVELFALDWVEAIVLFSLSWAGRCLASAWWSPVLSSALNTPPAEATSNIRR